MTRTLPSAFTRANVGLWCLLVLLVYFLGAWEIRPLFFSNQNTYVLQGLRLGGVEGLQADWLSHTRSPHLAFTLLVAALQSAGLLGAGVHLLELLLYAGLVWSIWILSAGGGSRPSFDLSTRLLSAGAFFVLLSERGPWSRLFNWGGLAQQYVFGGYLQPSEFGIAILVGIALLSLKRYRLAVACLALASTFHVSYLLPCAGLAVLIAAERAFDGERREPWVLLVMFGVAVAPATLYALSFGGDVATSSQASSLLAREIIPQHAWPAFWFSSDQLMKIVVMTLGTIVGRRVFSRPVAVVMAGSLLLIVVGTAFVYVSGNTYVALLFPWRASAYLYPLSLLALLMHGVSIVQRMVRQLVPMRIDVALNAGAALLAIVMVGETARELTMSHAEPTFPFAADVGRRTKPNDQIIVPPLDLDIINRFRLLTMRPTYVDRKSHPYLAAEVLEWKRRVDAVDAFYRLPPQRRAERCRQMGATFYVSASEEAAGAVDTPEPVLTLVPCTDS
jgi:hypothetical protein